tara:strand:+ start:873 stop:1454 length:582 start_codon:yes stop_codon:yes gene_type:complete
MYPTQFDDLIAQESIEQAQTLIFNKLTGALVAKMIGSHLDLVNTKYCKGKIETFNPETHEYVGDFDSGSVQNKAVRPRTASELDLDETAGIHIRKKYNYHHQLNHIIDMMKLLLDASSLTEQQKASFNAMKEYIDEIRDLNGKYKDSYQNDPNWNYKTKETVRDDVNAKMAGGISEEVKSERELSGINIITDR